MSFYGEEQTFEGDAAEAANALRKSLRAVQKHLLEETTLRIFGNPAIEKATFGRYNITKMKLLQRGQMTMPTKEMYMWFNKRGERVRNASGEKELARLLKNRECLVQLRMEARGISREEALKDWGTIVKVGNPPEIMKEEELDRIMKEN